MLYITSMDDIANNIAKATFDVINEGKVRTVDMGGEHGYHCRLQLHINNITAQVPQLLLNSRLPSRGSFKSHRCRTFR